MKKKVMNLIRTRMQIKMWKLMMLTTRKIMKIKKKTKRKRTIMIVYSTY